MPETAILARSIMKEKKFLEISEVCKECRFRELCEELEYPLDCKDATKCERYDVFLEGLEEYD